MKELVESAIKHFLSDKQPPALAENGLYGGLRVKCAEKPFYRFDPVGLVIPRELFRGYPEGIRISTLLDSSSELHDENLSDFFSDVAPNALQELQDIHDNIVCNDSGNFTEKFEMELRDYGVRFKIKDLEFPSDKPNKRKGKTPRPIYPEHLNFVKLLATDMGTNQLTAIKALGFTQGLFSKRNREGGTTTQNDRDLYAKWIEEQTPDVVEFLGRNGCTFGPRIDSSDAVELTEEVATTAPEIETTVPEVKEPDAVELTEEVVTTAPEIETTVPEVKDPDAVKLTEEVVTTAPKVETESAEQDEQKSPAPTLYDILFDPKSVEKFNQSFARELTSNFPAIQKLDPSNYIEKFLMKRIEALERENNKLRKAAMMLLGE